MTQSIHGDAPLGEHTAKQRSVLYGFSACACAAMTVLFWTDDVVSSSGTARSDDASSRCS